MKCSIMRHFIWVFGSSLFAKVLVQGFVEYKVLIFEFSRRVENCVDPDQLVQELHYFRNRVFPRFSMVRIKHFVYTVEPVLSGHSKIDKTKLLKTNGS